MISWFIVGLCAVLIVGVFTSTSEDVKLWKREKRADVNRW